MEAQVGNWGSARRDREHNEGRNVFSYYLASSASYPRLPSHDNLLYKRLQEPMSEFV